MASSADLIRPLQLDFPRLGFEMLVQVGPKTIWTRTQGEPSLTVTVNVVPMREANRFHFEPWLLLDGKPLNVRIQPSGFRGDMPTWVDQQLPQYAILAQLEDFYVRGNVDIEEPMTDKGTLTSVAFR